MIRTEVFEKGQVIFIAYHSFERRDDNASKGVDTRLRLVVDKFHQSIIEELDAIFEISEALMSVSNPKAHEKLGAVFLQSHIFDKAEQHFKKAFALDGTCYKSKLYLAKTFYMQKRYHHAIEVMEEMLNDGINYPDLYNLLGMSFLHKKNEKKAMHYFKLALSKNPKYLEALFNMALTLTGFVTRLASSKKLPNKSVKTIGNVMRKIAKVGNEVDKKNVVQIYKQLVNGEHQKALLSLEEYMDERFYKGMRPEIIGYKFYLRLKYNDSEMSNEALDTYKNELEEAIAKHPDYADLHHYLAIVLLMQCRAEFLNGIGHYREASKLRPNYEKAI